MPDHHIARQHDGGIPAARAHGSPIAAVAIAPTIRVIPWIAPTPWPIPSQRPIPTPRIIESPRPVPTSTPTNVHVHPGIAPPEAHAPSRAVPTGLPAHHPHAEAESPVVVVVRIVIRHVVEAPIGSEVLRSATVIVVIARGRGGCRRLLHRLSGLWWRLRRNEVHVIVVLRHGLRGAARGHQGDRGDQHGKIQAGAHGCAVVGESFAPAPKGPCVLSTPLR